MIPSAIPTVAHRGQEIRTCFMTLAIFPIFSTIRIIADLPWRSLHSPPTDMIDVMERRTRGGGFRLTEEQFGQLVDQALEGIPEQFRPYLENVIIDVQPLPNPTLLRSVGIDDPHDLLGIYMGRPMTEKSVEEGHPLPDRVILFQKNIEACARTRQELIDEIRTTVLHEIGHHFGLDEDDLEELGYG